MPTTVTVSLSDQEDSRIWTLQSGFSSKMIKVSEDCTGALSVGYIEKETQMAKRFGVVVVPPAPEERYTDSSYETLDEAEGRRKFLEAHLVGAKIQIADWEEVSEIARVLV